MKLKEFIKHIQLEVNRDSSLLNKEVNFVDYKTMRAYNISDKLQVVDLSDENYFDIVFNYNE